MHDMVAIITEATTGYIIDVVLLPESSEPRDPEAVQAIRGEILTKLPDDEKYRIIFRNVTRGRSYLFGFTTS